jgi:hypothetical protein
MFAARKPLPQHSDSCASAKAVSVQKSECFLFGHE